MADLNDELLNYELGDIDDHDLTVNEDELLLLSDEDSPIKYSAQHEEVLLDESEAWVNSQLFQQEKDNATQNKSNSENKPELKSVEKKITDDRNITTTSKNQLTAKLDIKTAEFIPAVKENSNRINSNDNCVDSSSSIVTKDTEVTTTEKSKPKINRTVLRRPGTSDKQEQQSKNDEVTSTNEKLDESIVSKNKLETKCNKVNTDSVIPSPFKVIDSKINVNKCTSEDLDENISEVLSLANESDILELNYSQIEDEGEDQQERRNPKTCVERDGWHDDEDVDRPRGKPFMKKPRPVFPLRGMARLMSPRPNFLHQRQSFPHSSSIENFNPHQSQPYNPQLRLPINAVPYVSSGQAQIQQRIGPPGYRMEYRPNYRQMHPPQQQGPMGQLLDMPYRPQHPRPEFLNSDSMDLNSNRPPFRPFNTAQGRPIGGPSRFEIIRPRIPGPSRMSSQQFGSQNQRQPFIRQQHILPQLGRGIMICNQRPVQHQITPNSGISISNTRPQNILHGQHILPRKVLINPNFKGGVQAATNQLMMDTLNNPQYLHIAQQQQQQSLDDELLRQQEEFINKNRLHIEKRRYETRSPDRNSTNIGTKTAGDWERGREFSPRRERRGHSRERQYTSTGIELNARGIRDREKMRFGISTDHNDGRSMPKRRKSGSFERDEDNRNEYKLNVVEEDEETKAYRLEIEKQKAMREKILRDKEMRRRKAAEEKLSIQQSIQIDQQKKNDDSNIISNSSNQSQQTQKLKPLVVKESKIISLKKNTHTVGPTQRSIPTAKILPETKRLQVDNKKETALVKPVVLKMQQIKHDSTLMRNELAKKLAAAERDFEDDNIDEEIGRIGESHIEKNYMYSDNILEDYDEDELLADPTTTPPPPLPNYLNQKNKLIHLKDRRRIVIRPSATSSDMSLNEIPTNSSKGIFERLEKKIGVAEAAKRKIQRIVIKNTE